MPVIVKEPKEQVKKPQESFWKRMTRHQLFIPLAALALLVLFNLIADPSFFAVSIKQNSLGNPVLSGNIISVLDNASELVLLAIGMTLVTASSGGQDISVGATMAIAGSVILRMVCGGQVSADSPCMPILLAVLIGIFVSMAFGAFNGALVAYFKIQPMVATLIMFTAGRSIAAWINNNELPIMNDVSFKYAGTFLPGIPVPTPIFITIFMVIVFWALLKFTNLGLYTQAVGINANSSHLNGLNPQMIKLLTYMILGACVAVAGFIRVSRSGSINYSRIAENIEMDAILAVALGGNSLSGGKFNIYGSIIGAYVIQFLTTTLYKYEVPSTALPAYKAVVVIILVVLSAPVVREKLSHMKRTAGKTVKEAT
ncbi:MAG: ABC transporter permease [Oscillibacter sp.]|jgi:simple sugar transport system permease protein|nr:ABC transporter permease [Oscillibacter sp.]